MPKIAIEALIERMKGIPEFILSKIAEIPDSYDKETTVAEGFLFEHCPKGKNKSSGCIPMPSQIFPSTVGLRFLHPLLPA